MKLACYQTNLQAHFGGGEVFAGFLTRALQELGVEVTLFVSPAARFWRGMDLAGARLEVVHDAKEIVTRLPQQKSWVLSHGGLPASVAQTLAGRHLLTGIAHMPLFGRNPKAFEHYALVFGVSQYVLDSLKSSPYDNHYPEPLYGVAEMAERGGKQDSELHTGQLYDWDRRKLRDRLLGCLHPLWRHACRHRRFTKQPGLTLGIVSRLTPIKQFPLQFAILAPILARFPGVHLEIFGSGGYASVRDLRRALRPLAGRVRFWGHQSNVAAVYRQIDFLMTGLPEKEALGLNVIEAQACGTPVLAVEAQPFTETVVAGETGFFYRDPRLDNGADFARLLNELLTMEYFPDPRLAQEHLARFSFAAFRDRLAAVLPVIAHEMKE